jgi:cytochrome P450
VLSYDLVRTVLRDSRFAMPRGISLVVQGISSGPVWDKVCQTLMSAEPAQHRRLRRLVSRAFTPRAAERMRGACVDVINELIDRHSAAGHCDMVHDIARQYPVLIICALLRAPASVNSTRKRLPDFTARNLTPATDTRRRATQAQLDALTAGRSPGSARCGPPITSVHSAPAAPVGPEM